MPSLRALLARGPQPSPHPPPKTKAPTAAPTRASPHVVAAPQLVRKKTAKRHPPPQPLKRPLKIVRPFGSASWSATAASSSAASTAQLQIVPKSHLTPQQRKRSFSKSCTPDVSTIALPRQPLPRPIRRQSAATADNAEGSAPVSPGSMLPVIRPGISPNFKGAHFHLQTQPMPHTQTKPSKCKAQPKPSTNTQHVQRGRGTRRVRPRRTSAPGSSGRG